MSTYPFPVRFAERAALSDASHQNMYRSDCKNVVSCGTFRRCSSRNRKDHQRTFMAATTPTKGSQQFIQPHEVAEGQEVRMHMVTQFLRKDPTQTLERGLRWRSVTEEG